MNMKKKNAGFDPSADSGRAEFCGRWRPATGAPPLSYFAASNSGCGFVSYFDEIFRERCDLRLIIKGGPGTGKSRMLFELGKYAEELGAQVEYYFCSSDPDSLDGIVARMPDGRTAGAQDATAPHAEEASLPGARDSIFDLGAFWNAAQLRRSRAEIERLNLEKSRAWRQAFGCLAAARELKEAALELARGVIDSDRLKKAAYRAAQDARRRACRTEISSALPLPPEKRLHSALHTPHLSLGMKEAVSLGGIGYGAREVFVMSDELLPGSGELFVSALAECAGKEGTRCRVSSDPLCPSFTTAFACGEVFFTAERGAVLPDGAVCHRVGMRRFIDLSALRSMNDDYSRLCELSDKAVGEALRAMSRASLAHFALEDIYSTAMDFDAKEAAVHRLCEDFFTPLL